MEVLVGVGRRYEDWILHGYRSEKKFLRLKCLDSDFFIVKRKAEGLGGVATYYKAKVGSLAGVEKHEIFNFG